jgi:alginate O-acetyltransferase complex protein AlgI
MGSASLQFIGFAVLVILIFNISRSVSWRQAVLFIANIAFLLCFSLDPVAWIPLAAFLTYGFLSLRAIQRGYGRAIFAPLLVGGIAAFVWLKRYTFIPSPLFLHFPYVTLGLSYIFFRVLHLIIDAKDGAVPRNVTLLSYLNYTLNFTTLVSGPIQRYQEFAEMQLAPEPLGLDAFVVGKAIERIIVGFFKVNVLSLALSMAQHQAIGNLAATQSLRLRVLNGIVIAAAYPLYLYCNFSGYIDIVIGIARFLRIELPENFNRPFSSGNFMNFWSRWHITLSEWLKTYVYNPLLIALMRRYSKPSIEPFLGVFAFFVTFFLVGVWHGQTSVFIFFGVLQGLGVSLVKLYQVLMAKWMGRKQFRSLANGSVYKFFARGLTFTWFTFTLTQRTGAGAIVVVWLIIFIGSSIILEAWERLREWLLSFEHDSEPLLLSRYVRTVWNTALVVIAVATVMLMNAPAPEIVYKAF